MLSKGAIICKMQNTCPYMMHWRMMIARAIGLASCCKLLSGPRTKTMTTTASKIGGLAGRNDNSFDGWCLWDCSNCNIGQHSRDIFMWWFTLMCWHMWREWKVESESNIRITSWCWLIWILINWRRMSLHDMTLYSRKGFCRCYGTDDHDQFFSNIIIGSTKYPESLSGGQVGMRMSNIASERIHWSCLLVENESSRRKAQKDLRRDGLAHRASQIYRRVSLTVTWPTISKSHYVVIVGQSWSLNDWTSLLTLEFVKLRDLVYQCWLATSVFDSHANLAVMFYSFHFTAMFAKHTSNILTVHKSWLTSNEVCSEAAE